MKRFLAILAMIGMVMIGALAVPAVATAAPADTAVVASAPQAPTLVEAIQKPAYIAAEATPNFVQPSAPILNGVAMPRVKMCTWVTTYEVQWWRFECWSLLGGSIPSYCKYRVTKCV